MPKQSTATAIRVSGGQARRRARPVYVSRLGLCILRPPHCQRSADAPRDAAALQAIDAWCRAERIDCLYCLLPASQWAAVSLVEDGGFRLVDVRVTFKWLPAHLPRPDGGESGVRPALAGDVDRLCAIAGDSPSDDPLLQ